MPTITVTVTVTGHPTAGDLNTLADDLAESAMAVTNMAEYEAGDVDTDISVDVDAGERGARSDDWWWRAVLSPSPDDASVAYYLSTMVDEYSAQARDREAGALDVDSLAHGCDLPEWIRATARRDAYRDAARVVDIVADLR